MRSDRALRALCRDALKGLDLDLPLDVEQLCTRYGIRRGRAITLIPHPLPAGMPNGIWLAADDADYFFYQANTTKLHQDQIVIHEFGHLIAGHQMLGSVAAAALVGGPGAEDSEEALARTCYSDEREREAETLASMIVTWADEAGGVVGTTARDENMRGIQRLLGGHKGWL